MKRIFIIVLAFLFLGAIALGGGSFLAKWKIAQEAENKAVENISSEMVEEILAEEIEIKTDLNTSPQVSSPQADANILPPAEEETKFSFAILGDTQYAKPGKSGGYSSAVANIKKLNPNLVFGMGDLVSSCDTASECEGKLNAWKNALGTLASKTYVMQGNHDRTGGDKADTAWEKVFSYLPTNGPVGFSRFAYSFNLENSHFVVLDSDKPKENDINGKQLDWLENNLAQNKKDLPAGRQGNVFVFFHEPAYPTNSKIGESLDESAGDRNRLWSILTKYKAKAVFSGHEHIQSRRQVNGLYQFVFGNTESFNHLAPKPGNAEYFHIGQAFGIVEVSGKSIIVKTYSAEGNLLNSFPLAK